MCAFELIEGRAVPRRLQCRDSRSLVTIKLCIDARMNAPSLVNTVRNILFAHREVDKFDPDLCEALVACTVNYSPNKRDRIPKVSQRARLIKSPKIEVGLGDPVHTYFDAQGEMHGIANSAIE